MVDWRIPQDSISNTQTSNWNAKAGQSTLLVQSHEDKCVMASLSPCGLLNLTSPTDRSPLGELRLPSTPSMAPALPLLTRGNKDKLVASLGGDIWIIDIASLNIEFCHDGHRKKSKGNQVINLTVFLFSLKSTTLYLRCWEWLLIPGRECYYRQIAWAPCTPGSTILELDVSISTTMLGKVIICSSQ